MASFGAEMIVTYVFRLCKYYLSVSQLDYDMFFLKQHPFDIVLLFLMLSFQCLIFTFLLTDPK